MQPYIQSCVPFKIAQLIQFGKVPDTFLGEDAPENNGVSQRKGSDYYRALESHTVIFHFVCTRVREFTNKQIFSYDFRTQLTKLYFHLEMSFNEIVVALKSYKSN